MTNTIDTNAQPEIYERDWEEVWESEGRATTETRED